MPDKCRPSASYILFILPASGSVFASRQHRGKSQLHPALETLAGTPRFIGTWEVLRPGVGDCIVLGPGRLCGAHGIRFNCDLDFRA